MIDEPLVLLPGMMCDARLFSPQISAFSKYISIITMPLQGQSTMADLARTVLDSAPPYFALAGLSMGGIVAMEIMRQSPHRVTRLALLDTNPLADSEDHGVGCRLRDCSTRSRFTFLTILFSNPCSDSHDL